MVPFVESGNTLTLFLEGKPHSITQQHVHWRKIKNSLSTSTEKELLKLLDIDDIIYNGVYYIYQDTGNTNDMWCIYSSKKDNIETSNKIKNYTDFYKLNNDPIIFPDTAVHTGTYASLDELLSEFVQRFL